LAHLADQRGWKVVDLLRVARARYDLETDGRGEQFERFEQLVPPVSEATRKPVQSAGVDASRPACLRTMECRPSAPIVSWARISMKPFGVFESTPATDFPSSMRSVIYACIFK